MWLFGMLATVTAVFAGYYSGEWAGRLTSDQLTNAISSVVAVDATLLGFLVSAGALLYAVANTRIAANLQRMGHFSNIVTDMSHCALAFLVSLVGGMACLFVPRETGLVIEALGRSPAALAAQILLGANVIAFFLLMPVGRKMHLLLTNITPENPGKMDFD